MPAGNYHLTVADNYNCQRDTSFTINEPDQILAYIDITPDTNSLGIGSIELDVFGGTPPYNITWSDSQLGEEAINLAPGDYTVDIEDGNLCQRQLTLSVPNILVAGLGSSTKDVCQISCSSQLHGIVVNSSGICNLDVSKKSFEVFNLHGQKLNFDFVLTSQNSGLINCKQKGGLLIQSESLDVQCKIINL